MTSLPAKYLPDTTEVRLATQKKEMRHMTKAQRYMLATLREGGGLAHSQMRGEFGRQWTRVFHHLERMRLVRFVYPAPGARHYQAAMETESTCRECADPIGLIDDGFGTESGLCRTCS